MNQLKRYLGLLLVFCPGIWLTGCSSQPGVRAKLYYQFSDGGTYRVDDQCRIDSQLQKSHAGQIFISQKHAQFIQTSFRFRARPISPQKIAAEYTLLRFRMHDDQGRAKIELGQDSGWLNWYGQEQKLTEYLTPREFQVYQKMVQKPLATIQINTLGREEEGSFIFRDSAIRILGKNRVWGEMILKTLKLPPVVTAILPEKPIGLRQTWTYTGKGQQTYQPWDNALSTEFEVTELKSEYAVLAFKGRLNFSDEELKTLSRSLGLTDTEKIHFQASYFQIKGSVKFIIPQGRPESGELAIEKHYRLKLPEEAWELSEKESHRFVLTPI